MSSITIFVIAHGGVDKGKLVNIHAKDVNYFSPEPVTGALISAHAVTLLTLLGHLKQITKTKDNPTDIIDEFCKYNKQLYENVKRINLATIRIKTNDMKNHIKYLREKISSTTEESERKILEKILKKAEMEYNLYSDSVKAEKRLNLHGYNKTHGKYNTECKFWKLKKG